MNMTYQEYRDSLKGSFAFYGFTDTPFTEVEIETLYNLEYSLDEAYSTGCDVASGFPFDECIN